MRMLNKDHNEMTITRDIPYYADYISDALLEHLLAQATPVPGVTGANECGTCSGLENAESLQFTCELYARVKDDLFQVLKQRKCDRVFIDEQTLRCAETNAQSHTGYLDDNYYTVIGAKDSNGRVVVGPQTPTTIYFDRNGEDISPISEWLRPPHVTLFGPPDSAKLAVNAMNAYHRKMPDEPRIIEELLTRSNSLPKWGADDEDSKTPLRKDLMSASANLANCFNGTLRCIEDEQSYELACDHRSLPIKRLPGIALPSPFLFYRKNPLPLHIYDFALHLYTLWENPKALVFYIPKLENEEEAQYFKTLVATAEEMIQELHPEYRIGTIRLMIVLENPRAIFRVNEIMDALYPYFVGASLGWHDYLASVARLFKEDHQYRIPVKSDPDIVVKYIKASHELLANAVGKRGGIKVGGMYGVLPTTSYIHSESFQVTIKGYIKDVVTQLKRNLDGFWVAHPDFIRTGLALVQAWAEFKAGDKSSLEAIIQSLLLPHHHDEVIEFIYAEDICGLEVSDTRFPRSLLAADILESSVIANNDEQEIRYNVFQSLQYITDWLHGNGCVALPTRIEGQPVRVMDDLATAERSRWEVWHELYHQRFSRKRLVEIAHEELNFIRAESSTYTKQVQVIWNDHTAKWYPVALKLTLLLMTTSRPVEFATELLLPFTIQGIQDATDPWLAACTIDRQKYTFEADISEYHAQCEAQYS
ncbi:aldolase/citrate lyase family protein [Desulfosediminicola flagellatus]|uniref:aldolase/citrate lyase family protein n=1 Tax=Desulfosediminicola flagellatus TaxID=2569541 RepID=UPI0010AB780B|nr:aldolase/citrate lyase family protein [Desulfosediminicola flagellatus]